MIRIGFGGGEYYTITIIKNHQNSIGKCRGSTSAFGLRVYRVCVFTQIAAYEPPFLVSAPKTLGFLDLQASGLRFPVPGTTQA